MSNTVLIVDDAFFMRNLLKKHLKEAGYEVIGEAKNGKEGIKLYFELKPDIVTMDINMPDISGIETTKQILSKDPHAKIIAVTGNSDDEIKRQIFEAGVKDYLQKPFQPAFLLSKIEKMLEEPDSDNSHEEFVIEESGASKQVAENPTLIVDGNDNSIEDNFEIEIMTQPDQTKVATLEIKNEGDDILFPTGYEGNSEEFVLTKEKVEEMNDPVIELVDNQTLNEIEGQGEPVELVIEERVELVMEEEVVKEQPPVINRTEIQAHMATPKQPVQPVQPVRPARPARPVQPVQPVQPTAIRQPSKSNQTVIRPTEPFTPGAEITKSKLKDRKMEEISIRPNTPYSPNERDEVNIRPPRGKSFRNETDRPGNDDIEEPILNDSSQSNYNDKNNGFFGVIKKIFTK